MRKSKAATIAATLRRRITSGDLRPGTRLLLSAIAAEQRVSRATARSAVKRLAGGPDALVHQVESAWFVAGGAPHRSTAAERVAREVGAAIRAGRSGRPDGIHPGQALNATALASEYGMGRNTIHKAFELLAEQGLVVEAALGRRLRWYAEGPIPGRMDATQVARRLEDEIGAGVFAPGKRLLPRELVARYGGPDSAPRHIVVAALENLESRTPPPVMRAMRGSRRVWFVAAPELEPATVPHRIARELRRAIRAGELPAAQLLSPAELASANRVSSVTARRALNLLAADAEPAVRRTGDRRTRKWFVA